MSNSQDNRTNCPICDNTLRCCWHPSPNDNRTNLWCDYCGTHVSSGGQVFSPKILAKERLYDKLQKKLPQLKKKKKPVVKDKVEEEKTEAEAEKPESKKTETVEEEAKEENDD